MVDERPTVVVTGASGFLGSYVCERLLAGGRRVRGVVRSGGGSLPPGVEPAPVRDLFDEAGVAAAVAGAEAVVHLAARVHVMDEQAADPEREFRRVNVDATVAVLDAALRGGVSSFVFASSVKAVGESTDTPWTDDFPPAPVDPYGRSKLEAEQVIAERSAGAPLNVCMVRLPLVYGAGMKGNMRRLFDLVDRGLPLPFGRIQNRRALIYAGNAAAAMVAAIDRPTLPRTPFFISDGQDVSTAQLVREIARALGRPARLLPVPPGMIRAAGNAGDVLGKVVPWPFRSAHADRLLGSLALDVSRFERLASFTPPFTLREGIAATAAWYTRHASRSGSAR